MSVLRWIALTTAALVVVIAGVYLWQMRLAYDRITGQSKVIDMGGERIDVKVDWRAAAKRGGL